MTLSTEGHNIFLEQLNSGFKRTTKWNKYRSDMTNQTNTNNLNYLMDPTFNKVNSLSDHMKRKKTEYVFQCIIHQKL